MAATVSLWSKPGAWALDSEEHETELVQHNDNDAAADFPSLAAAAAAKPKKKKAQTLSLAQFTAQSYQHQEEPIVLPTAPRQRTADELDRDRNRLGGAFRSYGGDRPHHRSSGDGDEASNSRWGSSRVSDEPRRRNGSFGSRNSNRELAPSRADEIENWAAAKKSTVGSSGFENQRRERGGGFFDSQSRADESDRRVSNKNSVPSEGRREGERKVGFGSSGGADSDNWHSRKKVEVNGGSESGRPRLVLQPRSVSVNVSDGRQEGGFGNVAKARGPSPFGSARPREELLAEKGQDWKKIDEQLESMKIKEAVVVDKKDGFGKRVFGSGNGRAAALPDDRVERSWRKPQSESDDVPSKSAEKVEDGASEETE